MLPHDQLGDGPAVLLLHAGIANRQMWRDHLGPLAKAGYRAVAVDLPGFGEAHARPELAAIWDAVERAEAADDRERMIREIAAGWVRPRARETVGPRIAEMQRANHRGRGSEEVEFAEDPLEVHPGRVVAIECPVLLAAGEEDLPDFRDAVEGLAGRLPAATGTLIPECGHLAPLEAPAESLRLILANLER